MMNWKKLKYKLANRWFKKQALVKSYWSALEMEAKCTPEIPVTIY
jgi:hypothetical protein